MVFENHGCQNLGYFVYTSNHGVFVVVLLFYYVTLYKPARSSLSCGFFSSALSLSSSKFLLRFHTCFANSYFFTAMSSVIFFYERPLSSEFSQSDYDRRSAWIFSGLDRGLTLFFCRKNKRVISVGPPPEDRPVTISTAASAPPESPAAGIIEEVCPDEMAVMPAKVEDLCEERESETSTIYEPSSVAVDSLTEGNSSVAETLEGCIVHQVVSVLPSACEPLIFEVAHAENEKKVSSEPPALSGASPQSQESEATKETSHQEVSHLSEELATEADPDDTVEMTVDSQEDSEPSVVPEPQAPSSPPAEPVCAQEEAVVGMKTALIQNRVDIIRVSGARVSALFGFEVGMNLVHFPQTSEEACKLVRQAMFVKMMNLHWNQDWGEKLDDLQRFIRRFPSIFFIREPAGHIVTSPGPMAALQYEEPIVPVLPLPAPDHEEPIVPVLPLPAPDHEEPIVPVLPLPAPDHDEPIVLVSPLPAPTSALNHEEPIVPVSPLPAPTSAPDHEVPAVQVLPSPAPVAAVDLVPVFPLPAVTTLDHKDPTVQVVPLPALYHEEPLVPVFPFPASTSALDDEEPIMPVLPLPAPTSALAHEEPILPVLPLPAPTSHLDHERPIKRVLLLPPALPVAPHAVCAQKAVMGTETDFIQNRVKVLVHELIRVSGARVSAAFRYKVGMKLVQFAQTSEEACKLVRQAMFVKMMNLHRKQDWGKKLDNLHRFIRRFPSIFFIIEPHHILYGIEDHENPLLDVLPPPAHLVAPMEDYPIEDLLVPDPLDPSGNAAALEHEEPAGHILRSPAPMAARDYEEPILPVLPLPAPTTPLDNEEPIVPVLALPAPTTPLDNEEPIVPVLALPAPTSALDHEEPILPVLPLPAPVSHLDHERPIKRVLLLPPALPVAPHAVCAQKEAVMGTETDLIQNRVDVLVHDLIRVSGARVSAAFRYKVGMKLVQFAQTSEEACKLVRQAMFVKMMNLHRKQDWGKKLDNLHRFIRRFPSIFFIIEPHHILYGIEDHENPLLDALPPPAQLVAPMEDYPIEDLLVPDPLDPSGNAAALEHEEPAGHILRSPAPMAARDYEEPILPVLPLPVPDHEEPIVPLLPLPAPTTALDDEEPIVPLLPLPASTSALDDEEPIMPVLALPAPTSALAHEEPILPVLPLPAPTSHLDHERPIMRVLSLAPALPVAPHAVCAQKEAVMGTETDLIQNRVDMLVHDLIRMSGARVSAAFRYKVGMKLVQFAQTSEEACKLVRQAMFVKMMNLHRKQDWGKKLDNLHRFIRRFPSIFFIIEPHHILYGIEDHENPLLDVLPPPAQLVAPMEDYPIKNRLVPDPVDPSGNAAALEQEEPAGHILHTPALMAARDYEEPILPVLPLPAPTSALDDEEPIVPVLPLPAPTSALDDEEPIVPVLPLPAPTSALDDEEPIVPVLPIPAPTSALDDEEPIVPVLPLPAPTSALDDEEPIVPVLPLPAPTSALDDEEPIVPVLPLPAPTSALDHEQPIVPVLPLPAPTSALDHEQPILPVLPLPTPASPLHRGRPTMRVLLLPSSTSPLDCERPIMPVLPFPAPASALDHEEPIMPVLPLPASTSALDHEEPIVPVLPLPASTSALDHEEPIVPVLPLPASTSASDHEDPTFQVLPSPAPVAFMVLPPPALPVAPHAQTPLHKRHACAAVKQERSRLCSALPQHSHPPVWPSPTKPSMTSSHKRRAPHQLQPHNADPEEEMEVESSYVAQNPSPPVWPSAKPLPPQTSRSLCKRFAASTLQPHNVEPVEEMGVQSSYVAQNPSPPVWPSAKPLPPQTSTSLCKRFAASTLQTNNTNAVEEMEVQISYVAQNSPSRKRCASPTTQLIRTNAVKMEVMAKKPRLCLATHSTAPQLPSPHIASSSKFPPRQTPIPLKKSGMICMRRVFYPYNVGSIKARSQ
ncbi:uncharacterized protein [Paramisgurnus dabryanus]|uniref:uncharacterized protein n=1 Tax=Paramisgurnus dabryanus TaxID=90735 RepID=UPI0031F3F127